MPESAIEPELGLEDAFYMKAFTDLQHDKTQFRSIPWSSIDAYAKRYRLSDGEFERLCRIVNEINEGVEAHIREEQEKQAEQHKREQAARQARRATRR